MESRYSFGMVDVALSFGPFMLDPAAGVVRRGGEAIPIGQRGMAILTVLLDARGEAVSKDELLSRAWHGQIVEEANLSVQIAGLRKALGAMPDGRDWIVTVPRIGYRLPQNADAAQPNVPSPRPTIAVLPFENLAPDTTPAYFCEGLVEDIITALSRFKMFAVVAKNASFAYGHGSDPGDAASAMDVRYVVQGSIRRRGDSARVSVRLIDTASGTHLLAQQFDGPLSDIFAFQDRLTEEVVGLIEPEIRKSEIERARRKPPGRLDAYDLYLRALPCFRGTTPEIRAEAIRLLEDSVRLDPDYAMAVAHLAWAYERQDTFGSGMTPAERSRALELVERALELAHDDALVVAICALVLFSIGAENQRPLAMLQQAFNANPNNPTVISLTAFANVMSGDMAFGRQSFHRALRIAPGALDNYEILTGIGISHVLGGEFEEAIEWAQRAIASNGDWLGAYWTLAAAYAQLGRLELATQVVAKLRARAPSFQLSDFLRVSRRHYDRFRFMAEGFVRAWQEAALD